MQSEQPGEIPGGKYGENANDVWEGRNQNVNLILLSWLPAIH